ncbi:MAG: hypothetical protein EG823_08820 [Actinobacteria bacterium]|nr:hypothetical protein [Actinomycetota bacterium]
MTKRHAAHSAMWADDGVALITVIGVMLVITILAIGSFSLASQTLFDAQRAEDETRAFRAASAGIDTVISAFGPSTLASYQGMQVTTPDGTATLTVSQTGGDAGEYEIVSRGQGLDGSTETLVQRFFYINLWEMNFAGTGSQSLMSGSSGMNGSSNIYGPFYIKGNLAVEANMSVMEGPLFVKGGKLSTKSGASQIGASTRPVKVYCDGGTDLAKGSVFVAGPFLSVPEITLPGITYDDMRAYSIRAQSESIDGLMSKQYIAAPLANMELTSRGGAMYKYFGDTTATIDPLGAGDTVLALGGAASSVTITGYGTYPCRGTFGSWGAVDTTGAVVPAGGSAPYDAAHRNTFDDFAYWDEFTGEWDLIYISGTVFVDGPLVINDDCLYIGNGTIVANGPVILNGRLRPYSYSTADVVVNKVGEDKKWAMGIVTPKSITLKGRGSNDGTTPIRDNAFDYAGAFYTDDTIFVPQPLTSLRGSILSNKMEFSSPNTDLVTNPLLPTYLPDSLPGGGEGIITPGLWSRM